MEKLAELERYLRVNGNGFVNGNGEKVQVRRQLEEAAQRIKRELDPYNEASLRLNISGLLADAVTATNAFIDESFKSDHVLMLDTPIEWIGLTKAIEQLSQAIEKMRPWMDQKTRYSREEWLLTQQRLMHAVLHECNQGFTLVLGLRDMLARQGAAPASTKNFKDFDHAAIKLERLCRYWRETKAAQDQDQETEATLFKRKMILASMRSMAVALRRLSNDLAIELDESSLSDNDENLMRVLSQEMEDARTFINFYLRGVLDLSDRVVGDAFLKELREELSQKVRGIKIKIYQGFLPQRFNVSANDIALRHIIGNLVANASKHAKPKTIMIGIKEGASRVRIQISNDISADGTGIPPYLQEEVVVREDGVEKKRQRLFVETFSTSEEDGWKHGIGLKLCLGLAEAMGGTIRVRSVDNRTDFEVILPKKGTPQSRTASGRLQLPRLIDSGEYARLQEAAL